MRDKFEGYDLTEPAKIIGGKHAKCFNCGTYPVEMIQKKALSSLQICFVGCHCHKSKFFKCNGNEDIHARKCYEALIEWLEDNEKLRKGELKLQS